MDRRGKVNAGGKGHARGDPFVAIYDYYDETGALLFQVCRKADKQFPQRRPDGKGGWTWRTAGVRKVLYRLPELIEAVATKHTILIVEGEKDVDSLWRIGIPATTNPGGAGKWRAEFGEHLRSADVVLLPDNDEAGWKHVHEVGAALTGIAGRTRVLVLPGLPSKGDVSDWLDAGGTREQFDVLVEQAQDWQPPKTDDRQ